ncbi:MAG TPA: hypothetical protein VIN04_15250, partial [Myxococcota bacterium]
MSAQGRSSSHTSAGLMRAVDRERPFWREEAWLVVAAGLLWLVCGARAGALGLVLSVPPGLLLVAAGVSNLLWPGDPRQRHFAALGAFVGLLGGPLALLWAGPAASLVLTLFSFAAAWAAGRLSLRLQEPWEDVPQPAHTLRTALEVAVDCAVLSQMTITAPVRGLRGNS